MIYKLPLLGLSAGVGVVVSITPVGTKTAVSLPPPEDMPEEVLRTEIFTEARSPVNGKPLTAAEYAQLQTQLRNRQSPTELAPKVANNIFLLRLRQLIRTFLPFLPI